MDTYWILLIFLGYLPLHYLLFHLNFRSALRARRYSKSFIDKSLKGKRNLWWYEELHRKIGLGPLYALHKCFVCLYPAVFAFHLLLGWAAPLQIVSAMLVCVVLVLASAMWGATWCIPDRDGKKGIVTESGYAAFYGVGFPLFVCYGVVKYIATALL